MSIAIEKDFARPDPSLLARLTGVPTGPLCDVQARRGALDHAIRRLVVGPAFIGVALTVRVAPDDTLAAFAALTCARPGDVVVIATGNWTGSATIGDAFAGFAKNCGVVAVVLDGFVRDLDGLERVGLPVYARGVCPNAPTRKGPGAVGVRIEIGGRCVDSGDIIVGDRDGVVTVPLADAESIARSVPEAIAREEAIEHAIAEGQLTPDWMAAALDESGAFRTS